MLPLPFFEHIYIVDFEFIAKSSELPKPVCVVFHEINSGETGRIWLYEKNNVQCPYSTGDKDLFIAHMSSAEWGCHLVLGWTLPVHVIDTYVEFKNMVNHTYERQRAGLLDACKAFGIESLNHVEKEAARNRILAGGPYSEEDQEYIMKYCESDVLETAELFKEMLQVPSFDIPTSLFRGEYMKTVAEIEFNGIPIDVELLNELQNNWENMKLKLIQRIDKWGIYEGTIFKIDNFEQFIQINGYAWPRTETGLPKTDKATLKEMSELYPLIQPILELKTLIGGLNFKTIMAGTDERSRTLVSPFWTKTSRNAPKDDESKKVRGELRSRFMFGLPSCLRFLIKPQKGNVLAYIDYSQQEFFIAAVLSNDQNMKDAYNSGDPYLAFAILAGAAPENATKVTHAGVRKLFKSCVLGVQYGLGSESLGLKIGKTTPYARELLGHHKRVFKNYWKFKEMIWTQACLMKQIETCFKWGMRVTGSSKKEMLTVQNFPIQATGAEILRVACILLSENNIKIVAPVHDAVMIEVEEINADTEIEKAKKLMEDASEIVLGAGNRLKTDVEITRYPDRFFDERGTEVWNTIMQVLEEVKQEKLNLSLQN